MPLSLLWQHLVVIEPRRAWPSCSYLIFPLRCTRETRSWCLFFPPERPDHDFLNFRKEKGISERWCVLYRLTLSLSLCCCCCFNYHALHLLSLTRISDLCIQVFIKRSTHSSVMCWLCVVAVWLFNRWVSLPAATKATSHSTQSSPSPRQFQTTPSAALCCHLVDGAAPSRSSSGDAPRSPPGDGTTAAGGGSQTQRGRADPVPQPSGHLREARRGSATQYAGAAVPQGGAGQGAGRGRGRGTELRRMNEAEGLRQRRPLRPQVITEDSPAQEAKEGRWEARPARGCGLGAAEGGPALLSARCTAGRSVLLLRGRAALRRLRVCPMVVFVRPSDYQSIYALGLCKRSPRAARGAVPLIPLWLHGCAVGVSGCCVMPFVCLELAAVRRGDRTPLCAL